MHQTTDGNFDDCYRTLFGTMGCVDGEELVTYKYKGLLYIESFKRMWNRLSDYFEIKEQIPGVSDNLYLQTDSGVEIYDTKMGFVKVKKVVRNISDSWLDLKLSNGRLLRCTTDHPLPTTNRGRIFAKELKKVTFSVLAKHNTAKSS